MKLFTSLLRASRPIRLAILLVALVSVFLASLTVVYSLPQEPIARRIFSTIDMQKSEGLTPAAPLPDDSFMRDGFTDAICLDHAIREEGDSPFRASLVAVNNDPEAFGGNPLDALAQSVSGKRSAPISYAAYWHGYLVVLRPALLIFDYYQLRYVNFMLLAVLGTVVLLQVRDVLGRSAALAFAFAHLATSFWVTPAALQFATMTYVSLFATLAVCVTVKRGIFDKYALELFLVFGAVTAFFDFLTIPIISFGVAVTVALIAREQSQKVDLRAQLSFLGSSGGAWAFGYLGAWVSKVLVAEPFLHEGLPAQFVDKALYRLGVGEGGVDRLDMLWSNVRHLFPLLYMDQPTVHGVVPVNPVGVALIALGVVGAIAALAFSRPDRDRLRRTATVLLVVPLPYLWYLLASNHSSVHHYFTYRSQVVAVFAIFYVLFSNIENGCLASTAVVGSRDDGGNSR